jgi:hypothetical protein
MAALEWPKLKYPVMNGIFANVVISNSWLCRNSGAKLRNAALAA